MKRLTFAALALCLAAPAVAQDQLASWKTEMEPVFSDIGIAMVVSESCHLRSAQWLLPLQRGLIDKVKRSADQAGLTHEQKDLGFAYANARISKVFWANGRDCRALVNTERMDRLDMLQYRLSGGYH